jgi:hypothetical protein
MFAAEPTLNPDPGVAASSTGWSRCICPHRTRKEKEAEYGVAASIPVNL